MNLLYRRRFQVVGIVQGVGFRPYIARLASALGLAGFVSNNTSAVVIEIEGSLADIADFTTRLERQAPAASTIEHVEFEDIPPLHQTSFVIAESSLGSDYTVGLPPDLAICQDCIRELHDPNDRRYRYPFLNCTACGPRYSIVESLPYDRARTSMRSFAMCWQCLREYQDPLNRRYHAQPVACPVCGPKLQLVVGRNLQADGDQALRLTINALTAGKIAAIRGIGGFHLVCNARDSLAVENLRNRKARGSQPFALMANNIVTVSEFVSLDDQSMKLLTSPASPIVLLPKTAATSVGESLAPGNGFLGVMLPYSPLHHLLLNTDPNIDALVVTSGNRHGEPIVTSNEEALTSLNELADVFLLHNRDIVSFCDDSVVRLCQGRPLAIRRGRGYSPISLKLPVDSPPSLATGADLKSSLAITDGLRAYISPHIGDMENVETLDAFARTFNHLSSLHRLTPEYVIHDAHPGYLSTQWAQKLAIDSGITAIAIQHHRAHAAAVMAEYAIAPDVPVIAVVFDGTGYGDDGAVWGGEFFHGTVSRLERRFHLPYVLLPGGDAAAKRPALSALAHLFAAGISFEGTPSLSNLSSVDRKFVSQQLSRGVNCHATSSMGRLFDAASSLLGVRHKVEYEAQAAIELESLAQKYCRNESYHAAPWCLRDLWSELLADSSPSLETKARRFIGTVTRWTCHTAEILAAEAGVGIVVLAGGVFQNVLLLQDITSTLETSGLRVLVPRYLPPNDGGIALGQLYLSAVQHHHRKLLE